MKLAFVWRSPLGRTYIVKPEPVDDPNDEPTPDPLGATGQLGSNPDRVQRLRRLLEKIGRPLEGTSGIGRVALRAGEVCLCLECGGLPGRSLP